MKLNLNFDGKTLLMDWWKQVKEIFQTIMDDFNGHITEFNSHVSAFNTEKAEIRKKLSDEAAQRANEDAALSGRINSEVIARTNTDSELRNKISDETTSRFEADNAINKKLDGMAKQNNILDLYGEEVTNTFKAVFPSGIPVPFFENGQEYEGEYMTMMMPRDVQVYINNKQLSFTWDRDKEALSVNNNNYIEFQYDTETCDGIITVKEAPINNRYDGTRFTFGLYMYGDFNLDFKVSSESPTGDLYEFIDCSSEYVSENTDTTGETYTLMQEFSARRVREDLQGADCFLDAVNANTSEIKNINSILGTLSGYLDEVNGTEE